MPSTLSLYVGDEVPIPTLSVDVSYTNPFVSHVRFPVPERFSSPKLIAPLESVMEPAVRVIVLMRALVVAVSVVERRLPSI